MKPVVAVQTRVRRHSQTTFLCSSWPCQSGHDLKSMGFIHGAAEYDDVLSRPNVQDKIRQSWNNFNVWTIRKNVQHGYFCTLIHNLYCFWIYVAAWMWKNFGRYWLRNTHQKKEEFSNSFSCLFKLPNSGVVNQTGLSYELFNLPYDTR